MQPAKSLLGHDPASSAPVERASDLPRHVRRSMIISIIASAHGMVFFNLIFGSIFAQYVRKLGLESSYPLFLSLLALTGLVQVFSTYLMERLARRRLFFFACHGPVRLLWLGIGSLPLFSRDPVTLLYALVLLLLLYGVLQSSGNIAWMSWMADLVPAPARGRYFGFRQTICATCGAIAGVIAGYYVTAHGDSLDAFRWVFIAATIFGLADIALFAFVYHPPQRSEPDRPDLLEMLRRSWRSRGIRRLIAAMAPWHFGNFVMWPFITLFMLGPLGMSVYQVQLILFTGTVFHVIFASLLGLFVDRFGHRTALILCLMVHFLLPLLYLFATPQFLQPVWIAWVVGMILGPTIFNIQTTLQMIHTAPERQSMTFAVMGLFVGLVTFVAPNVGQYAAQILRGYEPLVFLGRELHPFQLLIASGALFRFIALLLALRVPAETEKPPTGVVIRQVLTTDPFRAVVSLFRFLRVSVSDSVGDGSYARRHPSARWRLDDAPPTFTDARATKPADASPPRKRCGTRG